MNLPTDVMEAITSGDTSGLREDLFGTAPAGRHGAVPAMVGAGAGGSRSCSVQQKVDIRIDGAQSPKDTAEARTATLKSQVNEATLQLDNQGHPMASTQAPQQVAGAIQNGRDHLDGLVNGNPLGKFSPRLPDSGSIGDFLVRP